MPGRSPIPSCSRQLNGSAVHDSTELAEVRTRAPFLSHCPIIFGISLFSTVPLLHFSLRENRSDGTPIEPFLVSSSEMRSSLNLQRTAIKSIERAGRIRSAERVEARLFAVNLFEPSFSPRCGQRVLQ